MKKVENAKSSLDIGGFFSNNIRVIFQPGPVSSVEE